MKPYIPTLLIMLLFLLIPAAIWLERSERSLWNERLFLPSFFEEVNRHTPVHDEGTYLPPVLSTDTHITAEQNPILIAGVVTIPEGVTLTIDADVNVYVHEYGSLNVEGTLRIDGTEKNPVIITTNEQHIENRTWGGLVFTNQSTASVAHTVIRHASPGISCMEGSNVTIQNSTIAFANAGVYTESSQCRITQSTIENVRDGVIAVGVQPNLDSTVVHARDNETKIFEQ